MKPNRRSEKYQQHLQATEEVVLLSSADRISILRCANWQACPAAFYRYFSSQEDLLDTFSRYKRDDFTRFC